MASDFDCKQQMDFSAKFKLHLFDRGDNIRINIAYLDTKKKYTLLLDITSESNPITFEVENLIDSPCFIEFNVLKLDKLIDRLSCVVFYEGKNILDEIYQISGTWLVNDYFEQEFIKKIVISPIKSIGKHDLQCTHSVSIFTDKGTYNQKGFYALVKDFLCFFSYTENVEGQILINLPMNFIFSMQNFYTDIFGSNFNLFFENSISFSENICKVFLSRITPSRKLGEIEISSEKLERLVNDKVISLKEAVISEINGCYVVKNFEGLLFNYNCIERVFTFCGKYTNLHAVKVLTDEVKIKPILMTRG